MMLLAGLGGNDLRDRIRPRLDGVAGDDAAAELARPRPVRRSGPAAANASSVSARLSGSRDLKRSSTGRSPSSSSSAELSASTGTPHAPASTMTLSKVSESRACVALRTPSALRSNSGTTLAWDGVRQLDALAEHGRPPYEFLEVGVVAPLGLRELRPSQLELGVEPSVESEPKAVQQRVVALDPRKPSEGEQAQPAVSGRASRGRREPLDVDRVTDPVHLDRLERERADVRR